MFKFMIRTIVVALLFIICLSGCFSLRDNKQGIVFMDEERKVYIVTASETGSEVSDLSGLFPDIVEYDRASYGDLFVFVSSVDGNREIYAVDATMSKAEAITRNDAAESGPVLSPDGSRIAFFSAWDYCPVDELAPDQGCDFWNRDLYVIDVDGDNLQRLTSDGENKCDASWSTDGERLIFTQNCTLDGPTEIRMVDVQDSTVTLLTTETTNVAPTERYPYNAYPCPSPDGQYLLFNSYRDGDDELYLFDFEQGKQERLTDLPGVELEAAWSPDGAFIAWEHEGEILVMDVKKRVLIQTGTKEMGACQPFWLPQENKIAFVSKCNSSVDNSNSAIYVMNLDGTNKIELASMTEGGRLLIIGIKSADWMEKGTLLEP